MLLYNSVLISIYCLDKNWQLCSIHLYKSTQFLICKNYTKNFILMLPFSNLLENFKTQNHIAYLLEIPTIYAYVFF